MNLEVVTETLTNFDIAERQLDRSIQLFLDEKDYINKTCQVHVVNNYLTIF